MRPNGYGCSGCPEWDDINGCWANAKSIGGSQACFKEGGACYEEGDDESSGFNEDKEDDMV